jgi:N-acetylglucosamine-6-phosphate deacetylase
MSHVLEDSHGLKRAEHIGRPVDELGAAARQCRGLKSAAQYFGLFVEGPHVEIGMHGFKPRNFVLQ